MIVKAVIFDLDGTLLNTLDDLADSTNQMLEQFGYPERTTAEICAFVGDGMMKLVERSIGKPVSRAETERCFQCFKANYKKNMTCRSVPYAGIPELLDTLRAHGIQTAVLSNKDDDAVGVLCRKFFGDKVDIAMGSGSRFPRKPEPDAVRYILEQMHVCAEQCIYAGDSAVDIETAKRAGVRSVGVSWGFRGRKVLEEAGADLVIDRPEEFPVTGIKAAEKLP